MKVLDQGEKRAALCFPTLTKRQVVLILLIAIIAAAAFTRFWRLGTPEPANPDDFLFDELHFVKNSSQKILRNDPAAWDWFGSENTHPPLSKLFMAGGMAIFGVLTSGSITGEIDNPFAWRFFGALFGVGSVYFAYLLGKKLLKSEGAGLIAAFLLTFEGLAFVQSRIATPDTYVLFFVLGSIYFLLSDRFLLSGIFFGAAAASKWTAALTLIPIVLYFLVRFLQADSTERRKFLFQALRAFPLCFIAVPVSIYLLSYVPMLLSGRGFDHLWDLNRLAYEFHTGLTADHPYESPPNTWPILMRPIYFYISPSGDAQIYSLGNPLIFWFSLPALAFVFWRVLRRLRLTLQGASGEVTISGSLGPADAGLLFLLVAYLAFYLPWMVHQPRIMFLYHYLPSLAFAILALAYGVDRLIQHRWGRIGGIAFLTAAFATFVYLYPHLAAVPAPDWLRESYFWFPSWR